MILWAICTVCLGLVKTGPQLIAVRFLLGLFEGGLFPGLNFIFSLYYTREELGQRVAIFFAGATRKSFCLLSHLPLPADLGILAFLQLPVHSVDCS